MERFNAREHKPFALACKVVGDRGETERAQRAARRLTRDREVLVVLGPTGYTSVLAANFPLPGAARSGAREEALAGN